MRVSKSRYFAINVSVLKENATLFTEHLIGEGIITIDIKSLEQESPDVFNHYASKCGSDTEYFIIQLKRFNRIAEEQAKNDGYDNVRAIIDRFSVAELQQESNNLDFDIRDFNPK
ncbi:MULTISPECIES: hypothetical protein [unclassified Vibrio]|uniref:hypothetical protein n=1 Tax=unclassified Vibrio TaxID=2614977 RepID=UPI000C8353A0|nr:MULTISPECIES: hypothetical protein [unclassified Vibrio]PMK74867.1 hypothetical protein BCT92_23765 [Vibrio sp. 10N.261.52.E5]TKF77998.1 hypothetical protein FCV65_24075 [Vibrio sp. F13]